MLQVCEHYGINSTIPFGELDDDAQDILVHGSGSTIIHFHYESERGSSFSSSKPWEGIIPRLKRQLD